MKQLEEMNALEFLGQASALGVFAIATLTTLYLIQRARNRTHYTKTVIRQLKLSAKRLSTKTNKFYGAHENVLLNTYL